MTTIEHLETAMRTLPEHALAELSVDFHEGKGETEFVRALFHRLRAMGVPSRREQDRTDLVVDGSEVEAKVMHIHLIRSQNRADRGFNDFHRKSSDLARLLAGEVDVLVGVVPHFLDSPHRKYASVVNPDEIDHGSATEFVVETARRFAEEHGIEAAQPVSITLEDPLDGRVELTVMMFTTVVVSD